MNNHQRKYAAQLRISIQRDVLTFSKDNFRMLL